MSNKTHWFSLKDLVRVVKGAGKDEEYTCGVDNYIRIVELRDNVNDMFKSYIDRCGIPGKDKDDDYELPDQEEDLTNWMDDILEIILVIFGVGLIIDILKKFFEKHNEDALILAGEKLEEFLKDFELVKYQVNTMHEKGFQRIADMLENNVIYEINQNEKILGDLKTINYGLMQLGRENKELNKKINDYAERTYKNTKPLIGGF